MTASLVPAPPWHYVGDFLVIEYWADPAAVAAVLPPGLEPHPDPGRCAALFVDWQSCADAGAELLEPARGQYKEFFIVVNALMDGEEVTTCPYIWVDRDFALVRGWIQGFPKKLGQIEMTRSFGLDCRAEGRTFGGTVAANDRRLAQGTVTLERESQAGPTHNDPPLVNVRHFPRLAAGRHDDPAVHELVRREEPRPLDLGDLRGPGDARAVRRAGRGARRARARARGQGLPLHVRLHGRRPRDGARPADGALMSDARTRARRVRTVAGVDVSPDHFIGGERVASPGALRRPLADRRGAARRGRPRRRARGRSGRRAPPQAAFPAWAALGPAGRAPYLHRLADLIDANVERLAAVECLDMAMLERSLKARVIGRGARNYRSYADLAAAYEERVWSSNGTAQPRRAHAGRAGGRDHAVERARSCSRPGRPRRRSRPAAR